MTYRIGTFEFDPETNVLSSAGKTVSLENRTSKVLDYFCRNPGRTISRDELLDNVWGRSALSDHSVAIVISDLRKALGDDTKEPRFIRTIPKKGYVFQPSPGAESETGGSHRRKSTGLIAGILLVAAVAALLFIFRSGDVEPATTVISVADIQGGDLSQEVSFLPDTITEIVVSELARYPDVGVKRLRQEPAFDAKGLVLSGRLSREEGRLVLAMQLENQDSGLVVWGGTATLTAADFYKISKDMAGQTATALGVSKPALIVRQSQAPGVEELYWRARYYWEQRFPGATQMAFQTLSDAIERDPDYAPAHAFMAVIYAHKTAPYLGIGDGNTFDLVEREIAKAGDQAAYLPDTYIARALVAFFRDNNPEKALDILNGVPAGVPETSLILQTKAMALSVMGRFDKCLDMADRALALDPYSESINWDRVWFLYVAGRTHEALDAADAAAAFSEDPHFSYVALILTAEGDEREGFASWIDYHMFRGVFDSEDQAHLETYLDDPKAGYEELLRMVAAHEETYQPHEVYRIAWLAGAGRLDEAKAALKSLHVGRENYLSQWKDVIPAFKPLSD